MNTKKVVKKVSPKPVKKISGKGKVKTTKKLTVRQSAKTSLKSPLKVASNNQSFWVTNGDILNSLLALKDSLATMSKSVYQYHVTNDRNDFADWVELVIEDSACAADLRKAKTPASAKLVVTRHLKVYDF